MATVTIDIPGIGTVEAENAASESTLRELVNLIKKGQKGGGSGTGRGGGGTGGRSSNQEEKLEKKSETLLNTAGKLTKGFVELGEGATKLISSFANAGDSLESAAGMFSSIPLVGSMFSVVAGAASKVADSFVAGATSGATFDGTIRSFSSSASQAGMTLDKFGGFLAENGAALVALGGETSSGAKRFSVLSKQLRDSGQDLFALGYSTETINEGLANYAKQQRILGRSETMTNQQLVQGSKNYLKEMDLLAKITGESRKDKEKEREALLNEIKFQAFASQLSKESEQELMRLIQSYPAELQGFVKDAVMSGTLTMKANQDMGHALGGTTNQILGIRQKLLRDERIGDSIIQGALNTTKSETESFLKSNREAIIGNDEYAQSMQPLVSSLKTQKDTIDKARASQDLAAENTDNMNKSVQDARADLASFSNSFLEAIAGSGLLKELMDAFKLAADLVQKYVLPAFRFLGTHIEKVMIAFFLYKGTILLANAIIGTNNLLMALFNTSLGGAIVGVFGFAKGLVMGLLSMMPALGTAALALWGLVAPVLAAAAPFLLAAAAVAGIVYGFKALGGDLDVLKSGLKIWWEGFKGYFNLLKLGFLKVLDFIPGLDFSEAIEETKAALAENAELIKDNAKFISDRTKENRDNAKKEKEEKKQQAKESKTEITVKKQDLKSLETTNKKLDKERQKSVDYSITDPVSLLGQELKAQNSSITGAEETKKQIINEKEQAKAKIEAAKETVANAEVPNILASGTQEANASNQNSSNELLAALNTKMNTLIRIAGNQLNVQRGMTNDLYNA